jgi:hypothetical protein
MTKKYVAYVLLFLSISSFWGCNAPSGQNLEISSIASPDPLAPPLGQSARTYSKAALIYTGAGVSVSDWQNTELIVRDMGLSYDLADTVTMNSMTLADLSNYGVIIVPGGLGGTIAGSLSTATRLNIRRAVRDQGVGYVGFCAGAWVAVGPEADTNSVAGYGFAVAEGSVLPYWYPNGNSSLIAAMVDVTFTNGSTRSVVWWGGPATPEWAGGVVARYDDGAPAISQTRSGQGFVVISGPHPEAPQSWRSTAGYDADGLDYDIAEAMILAALNHSPML